MTLRCPANCIEDFHHSNVNDGPICSRIVRKGSYFRKSDSRWINRFQCLKCRRTFSSATFNACFGQKKRRVNGEVFKLFCSGMSQRRMARHLNIHGITVARKLKFLAAQCKIQNKLFLEKISGQRTLPFRRVQFDEMETFEHTKCKPLSIALMVSDDFSRERVILGFEVSQMPAKGPLAQVAREKYGFRRDFRSRGLRSLLFETSPFLQSTSIITTDQNPRYPALIEDRFPNATHVAVKGRRGCIVGQGELKKIGFDPLFSLNHTCAMFRANVNRLFRKTWCTTKKVEALKQHLELYVNYHNQILLNL